MKPLKIGISGVRGVVGETFTPELVVGFAQAFGTYLGPGRVLVCRDTRPSGPMVAARGRWPACSRPAATSSTSASARRRACSSPCAWLGADGGISITAGHNPVAVERPQVRPARRPLPHAGPGRGTARHLPPGAVREGDVGPDPRRASSRAKRSPHHLDVLSASFDLDAVRARRLKVAVDCCNGVLLAARAAVARRRSGARCSPSTTTRRAPFPAHAGAAAGDGGAGARAREGRPRRPRPGARRGRRAARPRGRDRAWRSPRR